MSEDNKEIFGLVPVRAASFLAAGMLICSRGGSLMLTAAAAILTAAVYFVYRKGFVSAAAFFLGALIMTGYISLVVQPVLLQSGTTQLLTCKVNAKYDHGSYAGYTCGTTVAGRSTEIYLYYDDCFEVGDRITARIKLSRVGGDDGSPVRRVLLNGSVQELTAVESPRFSVMRGVAGFRDDLTSDILSYCGDRYGELAKGLLFGDTSGFPMELRYTAKVGGVLHFTAVSGTHFIIIMSVILQLCGTRRRLRAVVSAVCIPLAVMFFGIDPTVVRSGLMLFLCNCGVLFARRAESVNSLCVSVIVMTVTAPYVVLDTGFQMSVCGVFGVAVAGSGCIGRLRRLVKLPRVLRPAADALVSSICATVCIAPVSVAEFGGISLVGVFATVVLTPVFTLVLSLAVLYAATGISGAAVMMSWGVRAAYEIILFFGSDSRMWLVLDFGSAWLLALAAALTLTAAALAPERFAVRSLWAMAAVMVISCLIGARCADIRRRIDFVSDGKSGAAVVCVRDEAAIFLCGSGEGMEAELADCLLDNGIRHLRFVTAPELTWAGAASLGELNDFYPVGGIASEGCAEALRRYCAGAAVTETSLTEMTVDGLTVACARSGDTECEADIVLYTGYRMSEPEYGARLVPLYVSSRQNILPEGGINIYDTEFEISLEN